jgi:hypothetical protein
MGTGNVECKLRADLLCQELQVFGLHIELPEVTGLEYSPADTVFDSMMADNHVLCHNEVASN